MASPARTTETDEQGVSAWGGVRASGEKAVEVEAWWGKVSGVKGRGARGRGFTTIELLVVIGILVLLAGLTLVIAKVVDRARSTAGKVTLETLNSAYAQAEQGGLTNRQPYGVWQFDGSANPKSDWVSISGSTPHFWKNPEAKTSNVNQNNAIYSPGAVQKGTADAGNTANWIYESAIANTGIALGMLRNSPDAAKILEALPEGAARIPTFWNASTAYGKGAVVIHFNGSANPSHNRGLRVYEAVAATTAGQEPGTNSNWVVSYAGVMDTFGNPTIYVPAVGIHVGTKHAAGKTYQPGDRVYTESGSTRRYYTCRLQTSATPNSMPTSSDPWELATPVKSSDGRAFWASAGPDGNFDTAEDNIYSFEN